MKTGGWLATLARNGVRDFVYHTCDCLTGVCDRPLLMAVRDSGEHLRLLLRTNLLRHQTSEQGGQRSHGSRSGRYHGNHVT